MDMHYDDGFDYNAPPVPDEVQSLRESRPPKLCTESDHAHLWVFPVALLASGGITCALLWGLFWLLK
jgi:hypothetical protein